LKGGQTDQPDYNKLKVEHATAPETAPTVEPDYQPDDRSAFVPKAVHDTLTLGDNSRSNRSQIMAFEAEKQQKMIADFDARTPKSFQQTPEQRQAANEAQKAQQLEQDHEEER
jgi:hypothetical protein